MADYTNIVKLALDCYYGTVAGTYSVSDSLTVLHKALIKANNGKTTLDYKAIRDGKCSGLFSITEEVLQRTVEQGLRGDEFFMNMVDYRNVALGDQNKFIIPPRSYFVVNEIANGTQGLRRQRLNAGTEVNVPTTLKGVKIYEELNRVLSNRIDMNEFIDLVSKSFKKKSMEDIYGCFHAATAANGSLYYPVAGSYDESELITLIAHVEAESDTPVTLVGTKMALRKIKMDVIADSAKEDLYNIGYYGKFNGTEVISMKQAHKVGTDDFLLDDGKIYVIPTGIKPIKYVTEGQPLLTMGDPLTRPDLTQEFLYTDCYGVAMVVNEKMGAYDIA